MCVCVSRVFCGGWQKGWEIPYFQLLEFVYHLSVILEKFLIIITSNIFFCFLFVLFQVSKSCICYTFWYCLMVLGSFILFFFFIRFSLYFSLACFSHPICKYTDSFLGHVQFSHEFTRQILFLQLCLFLFFISNIPSWFFKFPSLCLHHPSVLASVGHVSFWILAHFDSFAFLALWKFIFKCSVTCSSYFYFYGWSNIITF